MSVLSARDLEYLRYANPEGYYRALDDLYPAAKRARVIDSGRHHRLFFEAEAIGRLQRTNVPTVPLWRGHYSSKQNIFGRSRDTSTYEQFTRCWRVGTMQCYLDGATPYSDDVIETHEVVLEAWRRVRLSTVRRVDHGGQALLVVMAEAKLASPKPYVDLVGWLLKVTRTAWEPHDWPNELPADPPPP